jgi:glycosyltransferase involved in cell wall biosynthesis
MFARSGVLVNELRLRMGAPAKFHDFVIVTAAHNAEEYVRRNMDSVWDQTYPREHFRQIVIDDASTDVTCDLVQLFVGDSPELQISFEKNDKRHGGCANLTRAFRSAAPDSIVLQLDGDDWLPDKQVLAYLNLVYQDPEVWMTYNSWVAPDGKGSANSHPIEAALVRENGYRDGPWVSSHLHSFRAKLFGHVRDESLIDPETGKHWRSAVDMAHYFPMLELSGKHARHLERVLYVYNMNSDSIQTADRERQVDCERRIRALERYQPLEALD